MDIPLSSPEVEFRVERSVEASAAVVSTSRAALGLSTDSGRHELLGSPELSRYFPPRTRKSSDVSIQSVGSYTNDSIVFLVIV